MTAGRGPAIEAVEVTKRFGGGRDAVLALDGVSLEIRDNEFFTLLGPSGCGKTTLLRLIAGFETPSAGEVRLHGEAITHLPPYRRPVNTVFQSYALFPHLSIGRNVSFGLEMQGRPKDEIRARVREVLALVHLEGYENRMPAQLSGGQQQRVALARALASQPQVLLLDEPLSALDRKLRKGMQLELKRLQSETGLTFVFVTHDQDEALTMSDRIAVMSQGRILQVGSPEEIYERPNARFVADFIGETNLLAARGSSSDGGRVRYQIDGVGVLLADAHPPGSEEVTLAVRPERAELVQPGAEAALAARVEDVVYVGTDTSVHLILGEATSFWVRIQNRDGGVPRLARGETVGLRIPPAAVQVLND
ncbi:MAG TPA: ABC transporter ATP-binding protein [Geminicoccaceae bacterium]